MFTVVNSLFNKVQSPDITKDIHQQSNDRITDVYVSTAKESEVRIHAAAKKIKERIHSPEGYPVANRNSSWSSSYFSSFFHN